MKYLKAGALLLAIFLFQAVFVSAQEAEERVVDEVVAVVDNSVITLSDVKREIKSVTDAAVQQGRKREDIEKEVAEKRGELIANLINEALILQKGKDLNLDAEVDASINRRFLDLMKQNNLKTIEALYAEMEKSGVSPQEIRELWRKQITRDLVVQREVQSKLYWKPAGAEMKAYYEKNKSRFTKPETVTISEIFLSFAGRNEAAVREKAKQLVAQLRGGADFVKLATENSDRPNVAQTKGKVDTLNVKELDEKFAAAIKGLKPGQVTDPVEIDQVGLDILRVDERSAASSESVFDENEVRMAILQESFPAGQKQFMADLRKDSYIKISDSYRPLVAPILFADERKDKAPSK
jgi:peptidyl-prolyl cis-trans isomerase SurA